MSASSCQVYEYLKVHLLQPFDTWGTCARPSHSVSTESVVLTDTVSDSDKGDVCHQAMQGVPILFRTVRRVVSC